MKPKLYVVEFSSANYAGAPSHCLVWAFDTEGAKEAAEPYANDYYYEEDRDQVEEDYGSDFEGAYGQVDSAVLLEGSEYEEYVKDPIQQATYYPYVNDESDFT